MVTANSTRYTNAADLARSQEPDGSIAPIIDLLAEATPMVKDALMIEGNMTDGHKSVQLSTRPSGSWTTYYTGAAQEKITLKTVTDVCGMLEANSEVDSRLVDMNGGLEYRARQDDLFVPALASTLETAVIYSNIATNPEQIQGLTPRFNALSGAYYDSGCIIDAGGTDDGGSTSIWIIPWSERTCHLFHPKGTTVGFDAKDMGLQRVEDANNYPYWAYCTNFLWRVGLALPDYRYIRRICNIDVSELSDDASSGADLVRKLIKAYYSVPTLNLGDMSRTIIYCNKTVAEYLHVQALNNANRSLMRVEEVFGEQVVRVLGAPVHLCDSITNTEAQVS